MNLQPKKAKVPPHKLLTNADKTLRYGAVLRSTRPDDAGRRFVFSYYLEDDTLSIYEEKRGNSGVLGGKFLERGRVKHPDYIPSPEDLDPALYGGIVGGCPRQYYQPEHLFVGATLRVLSHTFIIRDLDLFTLNFATSHPQQFPWADTNAILDRLRSAPSTARALDTLQAAWGSAAERPNDDARATLLAAFRQGLSEQEAVTLCRAFDNSGSRQGSRRAGRPGDSGSTVVRVAAMLRALAASGDDSEVNLPLEVALQRDADAARADVMRDSSGNASPQGVRSVLRLFNRAFQGRHHHLAAFLSKHDSSATGSLERSEFARALRDCATTAQFPLSGEQLSAIVDHFCPGPIRSLKYSEFLDLVESIDN